LEPKTHHPYKPIPRHPARSGRRFAGLALLGFLLAVACAPTPGESVAQVQDQTRDTFHIEANRPELSLPIADRKRVIAHYMTGMIPTPLGEADHWMAPELYDPNGRTAAIGGVYQTIPVTMLLYPKLPAMKDAALLEMRAAKALGVDGFNFYYPFGPDEAFRDRYDSFILSFFDAAKENNLDFKLTICFAPYGGKDMTTAQKAELLGGHLGKMLKHTGESDHWLRTPDGRYLFYTWLADAILNEDLQGRHWEIRDRPELLGKAAAVYDRIAKIAGVRGAFLYHLDQPSDPGIVEKALDYFPAVTGWVSAGEELETWKRVAQRCKQRGRTYVQEIHPDYYTSKVYRPNSYEMIFDPQEAAATGMDKIERHAHVLGLTQTFRDKLQMAVDLDSPLINFTTWNDYPEGHHLAPEINHNFGFALLLKHYLARWRGTDEGLPEDTVIVFFKKYPSSVTPEPFDVPVATKKAVGGPGVEDGIEVVTMLASPGVLHVNDGPPHGVPAGLAVSRFQMQPGPVRARVERAGQIVAELTTPEWITWHPFRTDRLTYSFSSAFDRVYEQVYGKDAPKHTSMQYAEDAQGVPQWKMGVRTER